MGIFCFCAGLLGGVLLCLISIIAGLGWFLAWMALATVLYLERIGDLLAKQQAYFDWQKTIEQFRFDHDHPNAAQVWAEKRAEKVAAENRRDAERKSANERAAAEKAEAKRRAKEPTFVSVETVPDVPPDFKPVKKLRPVDFSAIEDAAKPRRKSQ